MTKEEKYRHKLKSLIEWLEAIQHTSDHSETSFNAMMTKGSIVKLLEEE